MITSAPSGVCHPDSRPLGPLGGGQSPAGGRSARDFLPYSMPRQVASTTPPPGRPPVRISAGVFTPAWKPRACLAILGRSAGPPRRTPTIAARRRWRPSSGRAQPAVGAGRGAASRSTAATHPGRHRERALGWDAFPGPQDAQTADDRATVKSQVALAYIPTSQGVNTSYLLARAYPPD
jgi:hypothetical protein